MANIPTYSNSSNARRAAKVLAAKHDNLGVATPVKDPETGDYWATVYSTFGLPADEVRKAAHIVSAPQEGSTTTDVEPDARSAATEPPHRETPAPEQPAPATAAPAPRKGKARSTKTTAALEMMRRKGGATAKELIDGLGWLPHTLRGFISLQNKERRLAGKPEIQTTRKDKVTTYTLAE